MQRLTQAAQDRARDFLMTQARPLEQARYAFHFSGGALDAVLDALAAYQNADGGFGRGLEPDFQLPESSVLATTVALQVLREVGAPSAHPLVAGAIRYLLDTYDAGAMSWPFVPPHESQAPRAPWWFHDPDLAATLDNPRPEIVGFFYERARHAPPDLLAALSDAVVARLEGLPDEMAQHALLSYLRLAETTPLPGEVCARARFQLMRIIPASVAQDPADWAGYVLEPVRLVTYPTSPYAPLLAASLPANLDALIAAQGADGAWSPKWTWGDLFPAAWPEAARQWSGVLTLDALRALQAFGRLAG